MSSTWPTVLDLGSLVPVAALWLWVFRSRTWGFWGRMAPATAVLGLVALGLRQGPGVLRPLHPWSLLWGAASAVVLWGVFWLGARILQAVLPHSGVHTASVYGLAAGSSGIGISALLLLVIGPSEELYWRGLVQWSLQAVAPLWVAVLAAALAYTAVHLVAKNPVLLLAALVGGLYWGTLFAVSGQLAPIIVSHALWDAMVLVWWPVAPATPTGGSVGRSPGPRAPLSA